MGIGTLAGSPCLSNLHAMNEFVAHSSRWRLALLFLGSIGFVVLGLMLVGAFGDTTSFVDEPRRRRLSPELAAVFGWLSIAFFGLCSVIIGKKFLENGAQLIVSSEGITALNWSDKTIPWAQISDITMSSVHGQKFINLHLKNPEEFPGRGLAGKLAAINRKMTGGDVSISLNGTDKSFDGALSSIIHHRNSAAPK